MRQWHILPIALLALTIAAAGWQAPTDSSSSLQPVLLWERSGLKQVKPPKGLGGLGGFDWLGGVVAFSPDGKWLAVGGMNMVALLRPTDGAVVTVFTWRSAFGALPTAIAFTPDGQHVLATRSGRGEITMWRVTDGMLVKTVSVFLRKFALHPDGQLLAVTSAGDVTLLRLSDGAKVKVWITPDTSSLSDLEFSPDGRYLATSSYRISTGVKLWAIPSGELVVTLKTPEPSIVNAIAFSPDGKWLAGGGMMTENGDHKPFVRVWQIPEGTPIRTMAVERDEKTTVGEVTAVAFSPDGKLLAVGALTVSLWSVPDGQKVMTLPEHKGYPTSLAFSPDGHLLAAATIGRVKVWRLRSAN